MERKKQRESHKRDVDTNVGKFSGNNLPLLHGQLFILPSLLLFYLFFFCRLSLCTIHDTYETNRMSQIEKKTTNIYMLCSLFKINTSVKLNWILNYLLDQFNLKTSIN